MIPVENKMGLCMYIFVGKKKPGMKYPWILELTLSEKKKIVTHKGHLNGIF